MKLSEEIQNALCEAATVGKKLSTMVRTSHVALSKNLKGELPTLRAAFKAEFGMGRLVMGIRQGYEGEWMLDGLFEAKKAGPDSSELVTAIPEWFKTQGFAYTHVATKGGATTFEAIIT